MNVIGIYGYLYHKHKRTCWDCGGGKGGPLEQKAGLCLRIAEQVLGKEAGPTRIESRALALMDLDESELRKIYSMKSEHCPVGQDLHDRAVVESIVIGVFL